MPAGNSRRAHNACKSFTIQEGAAKKVDDLKSYEAWAAMLTDDELLGFAISLQYVKPDEKHTREWAEKKIRGVTRPRFLARLACLAFASETNVLDQMEAVKLFVPAAPQKIEVDQKNTNFNCNFTSEDLKDKESREKAYAAVFGEIPIIED
jgi:hypothetical protein